MGYSEFERLGGYVVRVLGFWLGFDGLGCFCVRVKG